jgi:hypothetical protein
MPISVTKLKKRPRIISQEYVTNGLPERAFPSWGIRVKPTKPAPSPNMLTMRAKIDHVPLVADRRVRFTQRKSNEVERPRTAAGTTIKNRSRNRPAPFMILADSTGLNDNSGAANNVGKKAIKTPEIQRNRRTVKYPLKGINIPTQLSIKGRELIMLGQECAVAVNP